jgi:hypothetical protein
MKNPNKKQSLLLAIPVIAAIALIPWATSEVFAQDANIDVAIDAQTDVAVRDSPDRRGEVVFRGGTEGWAIIGGQAFISEIGIGGKAMHQGNGVWKVNSEAEITVGDRHATLDLKGKAAHGKLRLHGTGTLDNGEPFRIFLAGHFAPVYGHPGDFVVAFTAAKIHNMETGVKIPLIQDGIVHVESVDPTTDDYEEFLQEFDVTE